MNFRNIKCPLCEGAVSPIYSMETYDILQCHRCKTSRVYPLPDLDELQRYYNGFLFNANANNLKKYTSHTICEWLGGLKLPPGALMLDVGGGGGFMAKAFEQFGMGTAYYVDLDEKACGFAKNEMKLKNVWQGDVCTLQERVNERFHFIYSRHVIEHVLDPVAMIRGLIGLLAPGGQIELLCPNGISLEYLGYPSLLKQRIGKIASSTPGWSSQKVWTAFYTGAIAHGMDPVRHLWAFSPKGFSLWLSRQRGIRYFIKTAALNHPVYSMYYANKLSIRPSSRLRSRLINNTFGRVHGACHLIVQIKRTDEANR